MSRFNLAILAIVALAIGGAYVQATDTMRQLARLRTVRPILTVSGTSAVCSTSDGGVIAGKAAATIAATVSGQAVVGFVRVQETARGLFIDVILSDTSANMTTALNAMDFSALTPTHPSPTKDAADTAASVASGGQ